MVTHPPTKEWGCVRPISYLTYPGKPVFDKPFERTARQVFENLCECLDEMNLTKPKDKDQNFDIETLRNRLAPSTVSKG